MTTPQAGILLPPPGLARYLSFSLTPGVPSDDCLNALCRLADGERTLVGLGRALVSALGAEIAGLRGFPTFAGPGRELPVTPAALWLWLRGDDRGEILHRAATSNRRYRADPGTGGPAGEGRSSGFGNPYFRR
ncbi:MAG: hypothetical protein JNK06_00300 [Candidatus Accumulibacter phosphatis]|uniref:hypothetical protein n=1 Tax=Candidatus Accumulibacter phosphatis TaxID=327160 RepID=UPI001A51153C|nr:hypothetical protein [Candidatus Accumulibacter phosphatis]